MNDVFKEFGSSGAAPTVSSYGHPMSETILKESSGLLSLIPEGRRLLALAKERNYKIEVISGREPDFRYVNENTAYLICPLTTKAVDLDVMALIYGLAIYELEQPSIGIQRAAYDPSQKHILFTQLLDITLKMCHIIGEFEDVNKSTKLVDYVAKLGHYDLYRGYRSGKSKEDLTNIYSVKVNAV
jgi:hypothetical protein